MNQLNTLYRALIDYRKNTIDDRECKLQRTAIISADTESDVIEITRKNCIVEYDWIDTIEKGLIFIEKAIKEERQFIRSNGEVLPIEKVKRTSKDSTEHLAKHSNLLTREPAEGQDLIPDHLYTVERLSDFTVYENRFLYMVLCFLRDFIGMRYEKIMEVTNTYKGKLSMAKTVVESNRKVVYHVDMEEEKKNDDYLREHNYAQESIDRILMIYKAVIHYLGTPLMIEVGKAPMLKPPITRTNVLKMNQNFKKVMELYEFISAYDRDGYEIVTEIKTVSPFVGIIADEIAETVDLTSFLTYEHGLGIKDYFKRVYDRQEEIRREEERKKIEEQLKNIERELQDGNLSVEEYISLLKKRIKGLEERDDELIVARGTIDSLHVELDRIESELKHSKDIINRLEDEVVELNRKYEADMAAEAIRHMDEVNALNQSHAEEIDGLHESYNNTIEEINDNHAREVEEINLANEQEIDRLNSEHQDEVDTLTTDYEQKIETLTTDYDSQVETLNSQLEGEIESKRLAEERHIKEISEEREKCTKRVHEAEFKVVCADKRVTEIEQKCEVLEHERAFADGRLTALRSQHGLLTENSDFTSKEATDELERQYIAFKKFFKTEWKKTKKAIRDEILGKKPDGQPKMTLEELKKATAKPQKVDPQVEAERKAEQERQDYEEWVKTIKDDEDQNQTPETEQEPISEGVDSLEVVEQQEQVADVCISEQTELSTEQVEEFVEEQVDTVEENSVQTEQEVSEMVDGESIEETVASTEQEEKENNPD